MPVPRATGRSHGRRARIGAEPARAAGGHHNRGTSRPTRRAQTSTSRAGGHAAAPRVVWLGVLGRVGSFHSPAILHVAVVAPGAGAARVRVRCGGDVLSPTITMGLDGGGGCTNHAFCKSARSPCDLSHTTSAPPTPVAARPRQRRLSSRWRCAAGGPGRWPREPAGPRSGDVADERPPWRHEALGRFPTAQAHSNRQLQLKGQAAVP